MAGLLIHRLLKSFISINSFKARNAIKILCIGNHINPLLSERLIRLHQPTGQHNNNAGLSETSLGMHLNQMDASRASFAGQETLNFYPVEEKQQYQRFRPGALIMRVFKGIALF